MRRPHFGNVMHRLIMKPLRRDLFNHFHYTEPLTTDEIQLTWLGTAGFAIEASGRVLLIDPFVSRPGFRHSLTHRLTPSIEAIRTHVPRADAIVCGHSHHDHIMDVPDIARLTGAQVIGSASTCNLCRAHGLTSQQLVEEPGEIEIGPFRITMRPSLHGRAVLGRVPMQGTMPAGLRPPLRLSDYRTGGTSGIQVEVAGLSIFHLGSADFHPETIEGLRCDLLTPCLVGREHHEGYTAKLLDSLKPRAVIPNHFDNFFRPLDRTIMELPGADLEGFRREVIDSGHPCRLLVLRPKGIYRTSAASAVLPPRTWS